MLHFSGSDQPSNASFFTAPSGDPAWYEVRAVPASVSHSGSSGFNPQGECLVLKNGGPFADLAGGFDVGIGPASGAQSYGVKQVLLTAGDVLSYSIVRNSGITALSWTLDLYLARVGDELA